MPDEIRNENLIDAEVVTTADLADVGGQKKRNIGSESRTPLIPPPPEQRGRANSGEASTGVATARAKLDEDLGPLFSTNEAEDLRMGWDTVQVAFVDEPRQAVEDADRLVAATMTRLAEIFAEERQNLEKQWDRGDNVSTEDLRVALQRYRSFFSRLLRV
jgi:hypothetical protein